MDQETARRKLQRMAYEIVENNAGEDQIILAGIEENGSAIARHMQELLKNIGGMDTHFITLRLDKRMPAEVELSEHTDFNNKVIVIIDDVANSGKTMLYAMKPLLQYHPKKIQTLALVDRSHKEFPVKTDYVGLSLATTLQDHIFVEVKNDQVTGAYME